MAELTPSFPQLETERLCLRQMTLDDARAVFDIFADDEVTRFYDLPSFTGLEQASRLITHLNERFERGEGIRWGIMEKNSRRLVGTCGYNGWFRAGYRASIGYALAQDAWGQGFMPEALRAVVTYGFDNLEFHRIEALVLPDNHRSIRVLQKLGFQDEGIRRGYGYWQNRFWDLHCFSLLRSDWGDLSR